MNEQKSNNQNKLPLAIRGYHWSQEELDLTPSDGIFYLAMNMTSRCNYRCPYCFVGLSNLKTDPDEMNLQQKFRVLKDAVECGAKVLSMPGRGEPMGDPHFWEVLDEANRLGLYVVVYTNGYFIDEKNIDRLEAAKISLYVKIDSFDTDVYETLVGRRNVFDRVRRNLDLIVDRFHNPIEENKELLCRFGINSVVTQQSANSIEAIRNWCSSNDVFYTCRSPVKVGEADATWDFLVGDRIQELREIGAKHASRKFTSATPIGQCGIYRFGITVENNGDIYVCPDARTSSGFGLIGNATEVSLKHLIVKRAALYPLNSSPGFCFVKNLRNPEEAPKNSLPILK